MRILPDLALHPGIWAIPLITGISLILYHQHKVAVQFLYCTRLSGHSIVLCGAPDARVEPDGAGVERAEVTVFLDQPLVIVAGGKGADGVADLVDGVEDVSVAGPPSRRCAQPSPA